MVMSTTFWFASTGTVKSGSRRDHAMAAPTTATSTAAAATMRIGDFVLFIEVAGRKLSSG
jgi:hypothetical protein